MDNYFSFVNDLNSLNTLTGRSRRPKQYKTRFNPITLRYADFRSKYRFSSSSSVSASTQSTTEVQTRAAGSTNPTMQTLQTKSNLHANWKTEIFGDSDSD